ncbi:hypothetical protein VP01_203g3 [Puccinia sorghi]|uniref:Uncharacterized protein n=1 Tax=Puccinia sorghi TaxID=27349 RepID=A0A0L6VCS6_9BASI|nr:hypothetical protein VP01_203g3 [Puccinia sorghi]
MQLYLGELIEAGSIVPSLVTNNSHFVFEKVGVEIKLSEASHKNENRNFMIGAIRLEKNDDERKVEKITLFIFLLCNHIPTGAPSKPAPQGWVVGQIIENLDYFSLIFLRVKLKKARVEEMNLLSSKNVVGMSNGLHLQSVWVACQIPFICCGENACELGWRVLFTSHWHLGWVQVQFIYFFFWDLPQLHMKINEIDWVEDLYDESLHNIYLLAQFMFPSQIDWQHCKRKLLNCLQLTCRNSQEASVVTPTLLKNFFCSVLNGLSIPALLFFHSIILKLFYQRIYFPISSKCELTHSWKRRYFEAFLIGDTLNLVKAQGWGEGISRSKKTVETLIVSWLAMLEPTNKHNNKINYHKNLSYKEKLSKRNIILFFIQKKNIKKHIQIYIYICLSKKKNHIKKHIQIYIYIYMLCTSFSNRRHTGRNSCNTCRS